MTPYQPTPLLAAVCYGHGLLFLLPPRYKVTKGCGDTRGTSGSDEVKLGHILQTFRMCPSHFVQSAHAVNVKKNCQPSKHVHVCVCNNVSCFIAEISQREEGRGLVSVLDSAGDSGDDSRQRGVGAAE